MEGKSKLVSEETPVSEVDPVTTVTAHDAVTTNSDNVVVANINGKYKRFEKIEHVPAGSRTYSSKAELLGQTKKQLETMYSYIKGIDPPKSFKDHATVADNVWLAFTQLPVFDPVVDDPESQERKPKANPAKAYQKKRETNKYVIKPETPKSKTMVSELAPQAQTVVEIIRLDGKAIYSEEELKGLMESNKTKLRTRQTAWRIFQYYRSNLIGCDVLVQQ